MARIGETREQCETRYGPAVDVKDGGETSIHVRAGFKVECTFFEGKCDCIAFSKMAASPELAGLPLTEAEQQLLMGVNSGGKTWALKREVPQLRVQLKVCDGLEAMHNGTSHNLRIYTAAYAARFKARMDAAKAADHAADKNGGSKGSLKDF
ncbi:hypothetical protein BGE01nite_56960 [Brevifollis gellanilyticus]|uniref:Uncharacterized protein n=2 Tax=Brevifollis gellanilyticus TaxID=748831 RepID=A0A512MI41_9BACT|nr:hypothetical protein BGE01nite_56960 [Brevifollis gellanilyticus]